MISGANDMVPIFSNRSLCSSWILQELIPSKEANDALGGTNTMTKIIDGGMTPLLQFIATHISKSFKDHLRNKWNKWMTGGKIQLAEVNKFLIQLEAERNEIGGNLDESFESEEDDNKDTEAEKKDDDFENDDVDLLKEMVSILYLFSDLLPIFLVQVNLFDQIRDFFGPKYLAHGFKTGSLF